MTHLKASYIVLVLMAGLVCAAISYYGVLAIYYLEGL